MQTIGITAGALLLFFAAGLAWSRSRAIAFALIFFGSLAATILVTAITAPPSAVRLKERHGIIVVQFEKPIISSEVALDKSWIRLLDSSLKPNDPNIPCLLERGELQTIGNYPEQYATGYVLAFRAVDVSNGKSPGDFIIPPGTLLSLTSLVKLKKPAGYRAWCFIDTDGSGMKYRGTPVFSPSINPQALVPLDDIGQKAVESYIPWNAKSTKMLPDLSEPTLE